MNVLIGSAYIKNGNVPEAVKIAMNGIDADYDGENGLEYVSEEAKKKRFESDLEYDLSNFNGDTKDTEAMADYMCACLMRYGAGYYDDVRNEVIYDDKGNSVAVVIVACS